MPSLKQVGLRFEVPLTVIEGGSGTLHGVLSETDQKQLPVNAFVTPRHVLRTKIGVPIRTGMVVRTASGSAYIVGLNGPSEQSFGTIWTSWQMFAATQQVRWQRRKKAIDPVTQLERDDGYDELGNIWVALEYIDRMLNDSKMRMNFSQTRIITGQPILNDDVIDGRKVTRAENALGVIVGVIT